MSLRPLKLIGLALIVVALAGAIVAYAITRRNTQYFSRLMRTVVKAGFDDKSAIVGGSTISYLEGPDNGPALLLIHGQSVDKYNYAPLLPGLAGSFRVFVVDCYGHGGSSHDSEKYNNADQARDLIQFARDVIGEPFLLSGHSSGGLVAAAIAAEAPDLVKGVLFEDPPFFTVGLPRARTTWNWVDLASNAHGFLESGESDWTLYAVERSRMWGFFGDSKAWFLDQARRYHAAHPAAPIRWAWLPPIMNEAYRGLPTYDPRFGDVFYRGAWEEGFDLEAALGTIAAAGTPVIYQRSLAKVDAEGILMGATGEEEAARARALLGRAPYYTDEANHSWHWSRSQEALGRFLDLRRMAGLD